MKPGGRLQGAHHPARDRDAPLGEFSDAGEDLKEGGRRGFPLGV
jgi:hypothetical protein